ncbi:MAG: hypothetical protein CMK09_18230 [Ponticaulis sp.]|nr:hypothetical protein [Ponticaulis sp.]|tara:strand:+ start:6767 stop:7921 length:1155 start_codon:yes stop_codon:yes gene_type:complete
MKRLALAFVSLIALAACQPSTTDTADTNSAAEPTPTPSPEAAVALASTETVFEDGSYVISWTFDGEAGPVTIEKVTATDQMSGEVLAENLTETSFSYTPSGDISERQYFWIKPANGEAELTATRLLPLEGGRNFRTLGGYETADGQTIVWDKLYRSGTMVGLTENDYDYLSSLDLKVLCDFRTEEERTSEPTNAEAIEAEEYLFFPDPEEDMSFMAALMDPNSTPQDIRDAFGGAYFGIAHQQAAAYETMFDKLAAGEAPLAFNCSAGKDRTGIGAALLLTALGVPRETVVHDYQLSDDYVDFMEEFMNEEARAKMLEENPSYAFFLEMPPEKVEPIMATYPEYIETFFADIEAEYGTVDAFMKDVLNVTDEEIASIRTRYLKS